jgi:hypothetical protein
LRHVWTVKKRPGEAFSRESNAQSQADCYAQDQCSSLT